MKFKKGIVYHIVYRLEDMREFSMSTLDNYERNLIKFGEYLSYSFGLDIEDPTCIGFDHIHSFMSYLKNDQGLKSSTINIYISAIRNYFKFAKMQGLEVIDYDLIFFSRISPVKIDFLTKKEMHQLLECPEHYERRRDLRSRNKLLIYMFYYTGLRVSELLQLKTIDLVNAEDSVAIGAKGNKIRLFYIDKKIKKLYKEYITYQKVESEYVFVSLANNSYGKQLSRNAVAAMFQKYKEKMGVRKRLTPHTLRHTFATHLLNAGVSIKLLQEMLNHDSLLSTQRYLHVTNDQMKKAQNLLAL